MVASDCGVVFGVSVSTPDMYNGNMYSIPNSPYSIQVIDVNCSGITSEIYTIIRLFKNGVFVADQYYYTFSGTTNYLFDNNSICISQRLMDCQSPVKSGWYSYYEIFYNVEVATHKIVYKVNPAMPSILLDMANNIAVVLEEASKLVNPVWGWKILDIRIDSVQNTIEVDLIETGSVDLVSIALDILTIISAIVVIVLLIVYGSVVALGVIFYVILVAALLPLGYAVYDLLINQIIGRDDALTNTKTLLQIERGLDLRRQECYDTYNTTPKTVNDCLNLIDCLLDAYRGYLESLRKDFPDSDKVKDVSNSITALESERISIKNNLSQGVIDCATAISLAETEGITEKDKATTITYNNYNMGDAYVPPVYPTCDQFSEKKVCEDSGCFWDGTKCIRRSGCWISNPMGGCLITEGTGKMLLLGGGIVLGLIYIPPLLSSKK